MDKDSTAHTAPTAKRWKWDWAKERHERDESSGADAQAAGQAARARIPAPPLTGYETSVRGTFADNLKWISIL